MQYKIPFNKPSLIGKELEFIKDALARGHIAGDGYYTKQCEAFIEKLLKANKVLLTTSCTSALEMASLLAGVGPADEVILPSFTFTSTANAFYRQGAKLKFIDIDPISLNMDTNFLANIFTRRTKVIAPVHYGGLACNMDEIMRFAKEKKLIVIEDAAHAFDTKFQGKFLGTIGDFGTFSFHETKNIICGEGGALLVNNERYIQRAEIIREKGTNRSMFLRGLVDKYTWVDVGSSYCPSEILSAFLYAQLLKSSQIRRKRKLIFSRYELALSSLADKGLLTLPNIPKGREVGYHLFYILLANEKIRDELSLYLRSKKILAVFHYVPLHSSPLGRKMGYTKQDLPVTENISGRLLRLPFFYSLTISQQAEVVQRISEFFKRKNKKYGGR